MLNTFSYLPEHLRTSARIRTCGQLAVTFPTSYAKKLPHQLHWELVTPNNEGKVTYTIADDSLVEQFIDYLKSLELEYNISRLSIT